MRTFLATLLGACLGLPAAAQAQLGEINTPSVPTLSQRAGPGPASIPPFAALDVDDDRQISQEEAASDMTVSRYFMRADRDRDRSLSRAEYVALQQQLR
ncbi:hypothetical protein [uncultured Abyssibacter sp.]|uniref:hypothetical protein n=1 Tax=uncultured Abyssibacter sp. TaxID=2320202 RepID=UPI0032B1D654